MLTEEKISQIENKNIKYGQPTSFQKRKTVLSNTPKIVFKTIQEISKNYEWEICIVYGIVLELEKQKIKYKFRIASNSFNETNTKTIITCEFWEIDHTISNIEVNEQYRFVLQQKNIGLYQCFHLRKLYPEEEELFMSIQSKDRKL